MHITAQSGQVASEGNLAGFREQAAGGIGDDAQDVIGQPPLEQLDRGRIPARPAHSARAFQAGGPELPDADDDVIEVRPDDHGVDPAGVDVQVTDGAVADIRAAPRQAVLEVRARFQMVAPAPGPRSCGRRVARPRFPVSISSIFLFDGNRWSRTCGRARCGAGRGADV